MALVPYFLRLKTSAGASVNTSPTLDSVVNPVTGATLIASGGPGFPTTVPLGRGWHSVLYNASRYGEGVLLWSHASAFPTEDGLPLTLEASYAQDTIPVRAMVQASASAGATSFQLPAGLAVRSGMNGAFYRDVAGTWTYFGGCIVESYSAGSVVPVEPLSDAVDSSTLFVGMVGSPPSQLPAIEAGTGLITGIAGTVNTFDDLVIPTAVQIVTTMYQTAGLLFPDQPTVAFNAMFADLLAFAAGRRVPTAVSATEVQQSFRDVFDSTIERISGTTNRTTGDHDLDVFRLTYP